MAVSTEDKKITLFEFDPLLTRDLVKPRPDSRNRTAAAIAPPRSDAQAKAHGSRPMTLNILFWTLNIVIVCLVLTNLYVASLKEKGFAREVAETNQRTEQLRLESERQRERAALAEAKLQDQRGSSSVGQRLQRLEKIVLPRSLSAEQQAAIVKDMQGLGPVNVAFKQTSPEPQAYALSLIAALQSAGILGQTFYLTGSYYQGVDLVYANDQGRQLADKLHKIGIVDVAGPASTPAMGYENLPRNQNTIVVGDNAAVLEDGKAAAQ